MNIFHKQTTIIQYLPTHSTPQLGSSSEHPGIPLFSHGQTVIPLVLRLSHGNQKSWTMLRSVFVPIGWTPIICIALGRLSYDSIPSPVAMAHETPGLAMCNRQVTVGLNFLYCFQLWNNFQKKEFAFEIIQLSLK